MKFITSTIALLLFSSLSFAQLLLLDVRSQEEFDAGHAYGAVHIPHTEINEKAAVLLKNKDQKIKVYCKSGGRAEKAKVALEALGYKNVENVRTLKNANRFAPQ
ncbi:hypothetical protein NBRC116188_21360 [Oceaniserpentilla sp. 4NH20-0058]|uniref:rhodanese-like domain-containing protein n=1 Tax=Oceaniserpentilla sp. 4NH20-0058 TaxID=3127660 RepID=UPI00310644B7